MHARMTVRRRRRCVTPLFLLDYEPHGGHRVRRTELLKKYITIPKEFLSHLHKTGTAQEHVKNMLIPIILLTSSKIVLRFLFRLALRID